MSITLAIKKNGIIDGVFYLSEIVTKATQFIIDVPTLSATVHPFNGNINDSQFKFTFTGKARSINPSWKDPFDGVVWIGRFLQSKLILNDGEYNGEYLEGTLDEYITMLNELSTATLNIK
ncbi:hypothetical protein [Paenibacillus sp. P36]|uniref:hypothetical protein n=1 Tax=Paenibacillus sp. P36 TaxID=3342538 RepID=UPI0038B3DDDA